jgi:thiosulfate dehydrogenase [quinone] large subunit
MLVSFFESFKYTGHLLPAAFLRIIMGYYFLTSALEKLNTNFLSQPQLAAQINEWSPLSIAPEIIKEFLEGFVVTYWQFFAHFLTYGEYIVGVGLIVGFLVRPLSVLAIFISLFFMYISSPSEILVFKVFIAILITLLWLGAGRCVGADYYFFKRHRGIWW